jgi:hypothetical protein
LALAAPVGCSHGGVSVVSPPRLTAVRSLPPRGSAESAPRAYSGRLVQHQESASRGGPLSAEWKPAAPPRAWKYIVLHHSATGGGSVAQIDQTHAARVDRQGRPWLGVGYHFVIGNGDGMPDGKVEATFRWRDQIHGAHAGVAQYNELGVGICLIGDFERGAPTAAQIESARALVAALAAEYSIPRSEIRKHGDLVATDCPGEFFPFDRIADAALAPTVPRPESVRP